MKIKIVKTADSELIAQAVKDNDGYCPCMRKRTPDTKCMCKKFREQKLGICHCGLYEKILIDED